MEAREKAKLEYEQKLQEALQEPEIPVVEHIDHVITTTITVFVISSSSSHSSCVGIRFLRNGRGWRLAARYSTGSQVRAGRERSSSSAAWSLTYCGAQGASWAIQTQCATARCSRFTLRKGSLIPNVPSDWTRATSSTWSTKCRYILYTHGYFHCHIPPNSMRNLQIVDDSKSNGMFRLNEYELVSSTAEGKGAGERIHE